MSRIDSVSAVMSSLNISAGKAFIASDEVYVDGVGGLVALTADGGTKTALSYTANRTAVQFRKDGVLYRVGLNGKGYRKVYDPADLNHVIGLGQSNLVGRDDLGSPSVSTTQPFDNVTLPNVGNLREYYNSGGAWAYRQWQSANGLRAQINGQHKNVTLLGESALGKNHAHFATLLDAVTDFIPLTEGLYNNITGGASYPSPETPMTSLCSALSWRTGQRFVSTVAGVGGADPSHLTWSAAQGSLTDVDLSGVDVACSGYATGPFADMIKQVSTCKRLADARGLSYKVCAMVYHENYTNKQGAREIGEIINAANAQIKAITGQVEDIILVTEATYGGNHTTRRGDDINALSLHTNELITYNNEAANWTDNFGRCYVAFNRRAYTNEPTHHTPHERRAMGEKYAQVIDQVVFKSEEWEPVRIQSTSVDGNSVYVKFHTRAPLEVLPDAGKTSSVSHAHFGIQIYNSMINGSNITTHAEVVAGDTIRFDCSSSPAGGSVRVAREYLYRCNVFGSTLGTVGQTFNKDADGDDYPQRDILIGGHFPI